MMNETSTPVSAWHFVDMEDSNAIRLSGEWQTYEGALVLGVSGLHACFEPWDALWHAHGPVLCMVELGGSLKANSYRAVASKRKILKSHDMTCMIRRFAAEQALKVAHLWDMPATVRAYLKTELLGLRAEAEDLANKTGQAAFGQSHKRRGDDDDNDDRTLKAAAWAARAAAQAAKVNVWETVGTASAVSAALSIVASHDKPEMLVFDPPSREFNHRVYDVFGVAP